ncbi:MAG TPA: serine/threonine-protein kinase, partial [Gemmataceae bacterium]|nr:serine/threonine-protein kinase [Gemmataceae bacterium]
MHIICPHCHNPIEVVQITPREEIACPSCGSSFRLETGATTGSENSAGQKLGKFTLIETLGQGAFGTVYKARDPELDRTVAIKVPRAGNLAGPQELDRFLREARSVAQLRHPSIVSIHEVGETDGVPYLVSDFVRGVTLADLLSARRPGFREAAELVAAVADALQYAHERGVVHRDVKPSNIMIGDDGKPCVMDFGLAKREAGEITMTIEGQVLGTPAYMSPEQARGEGHSVDGRGDVYSLGVVLYELLTGELPFRGTQRMLLHQVLHDEPRPPRRLNDSIPRDLNTICLKCLRKEAARRYESAAALADDLRRFLAGRPIVARPVGRLERAARWVRRNPVLAGMTAVVVLALLAGTGVSTGFGIAERQQAELAKKNEAAAIAKGNELATANDDLKHSRDDLKLTVEDLKRSRDELETTLAQSLLRPLGLQNAFNRRVTEPEWEALWELATNRRGRLGYRFVEEASRTPATSRQLRDRASLALSAAVGLDAERRAEVEAVLMARLDDPALGDEQKRDLALAASAWDGLSNSAARRTAKQLTRAITDARDPRALDSLAGGLSAVVARLDAKDAATVAAQAATTLVQAMKGTKEPLALRSLAKGLSAVAGRMEAHDAATVTAQAATTLVQAIKDMNSLSLPYLTEGLSAVVARMEAKDVTTVAAQAANILVQAMKDTTFPGQLPSLAEALAAVAAHLEAEAAATVAAQAATTLVQAMKDTKEPSALWRLASGLSAVAAHLEAEAAATVAAQAATTLVQVSKDTKNADALYSLALGLSAVAARLEAKDAAQAATTLVQVIKDTKNAGALRSLVWSLSAVAARLEAKDAAQAATTLVRVIKDTKNADALQYLPWGLSAVAARLEAGDAAQAATTLVQVIKDTKEPLALRSLAEGLSAVAARMEARDAATVTAQAAATLLPVIRDTKNADALRSLAWGLSALAARMEAQDAATVAAQAATTLLRAIKDTKEPLALRSLAEGLSAVAARMEANDAATVTAQAATTLLQVSKDTKDPRALQYLAWGLSAVAARLEAKDVAQAATTLAQALKDTDNPSVPLGPLAEGLSAVAARLEAKDAAQAAATLIQGMDDPEDLLPWRAQPLSALLSAVPRAEIPSRTTTVASAVALPAGTGHPLTILALLIPAAGPLPCRLSTQQLVELLKRPACVGKVRRIILDHLGNHYRRTFADVWEFVRFAKEQNLDLDFTTPPQRPEPAATA